LWASGALKAEGVWVLAFVPKAGYLDDWALGIDAVINRDRRFMHQTANAGPVKHRRAKVGMRAKHKLAIHQGIS